MQPPARDGLGHLPTSRAFVSFLRYFFLASSGHSFSTPHLNQVHPVREWTFAAAPNASLRLGWSYLTSSGTLAPLLFPVSMRLILGATGHSSPKRAIAFATYVTVTDDST